MQLIMSIVGMAVLIAIAVSLLQQLVERLDFVPLAVLF
ncbi:Uncharacterised protein [Providencia rustigianii]|nr:Uncharacterised protein [Providencia rustigianii]